MYSILKLDRLDGRRAAEVICWNGIITPIFCETDSLREFFDTVAKKGIVTDIWVNEKERISINAVPGTPNFIGELYKYIQKNYDYLCSLQHLDGSITVTSSMTGSHTTYNILEEPNKWWNTNQQLLPSGE